MDAKEAIALAKSWIADIYVGEQIRNIGLEEIRFDERKDNWLVTVGFSRPWDDPTAVALPVTRDPLRRSYKVVKIADRNGKVLAVEDRVLAKA